MLAVIYRKTGSVFFLLSTWSSAPHHKRNGAVEMCLNRWAHVLSEISELHSLTLKAAIQIVTPMSCHIRKDHVSGLCWSYVVDRLCAPCIIDAPIYMLRSTLPINPPRCQDEALSVINSDTRFRCAREKQPFASTRGRSDFGPRVAFDVLGVIWGVVGYVTHIYTIVVSDFIAEIAFMMITTRCMFQLQSSFDAN